MPIQTLILKLFEKQKEIDNIQGKSNTWFCGAYLGYGFHEDGISSSLKVAKRFMKLRKKISDHCEDKLFTGIVSHSRHKPFKHSFKYKLTYFWFNINNSYKSFLFKKIGFQFFLFMTKIMDQSKKLIQILQSILVKKLVIPKRNSKKFKLFACQEHLDMYLTLFQFSCCMTTKIHLKK